MALTDKKVGVLMGGASAEREVSIRSGTAVYHVLKDLGYNVVSIDVGRDICEVLRREAIEFALLVLHGGWGEDGSIQGLLEVLGIPYSGSGVLASALAMDKEATKKVFCFHHIPVAPFVVVTGNEALAAGDSGVSAIDFPMPWVIKPATEGSSIGVSIIKEPPQIRSAVKQALTYGERVIFEQYIKGREVQVGILNDRVLGSVEVRPKAEFYSFEAKYTAGLTDYILPPELETGLLHRAEQIALSAHRSLGCRGATRVDLIVDEKGTAYVLEVNTIPGMTETSLLPKIAGLSGLSFSGLIEEIIGETIARSTKR